jgi:hypothetical protein
MRSRTDPTFECTHLSLLGTHFLLHDFQLELEDFDFTAKDFQLGQWPWFSSLFDRWGLPLPHSPVDQAASTE